MSSSPSSSLANGDGPDSSAPDSGDGSAPRQFLDQRASVVRRPPPSKVGAIDVGTNSVHLVMAEISPDGDFQILGRDKDMAQLGLGGFVEHLLTERAMDDAAAAMTRFVKMARLKGIHRIVAVATSAVREAKNGGDFVERVRRELDLELRILSAEEEARLIYLAVRHAVNLGDHDHLIVDIGGGSMEVIIGDVRRAETLFSAKLGGLRLSELFLHSDPPALGELKAMRRHVQSSLEELAARSGNRTFDRCIGTSGTFECIAAICAHRRGVGEVTSVGQLTLSRTELKTLQAELAGATRQQILRLPGMDPRRAGSILPAITTLRSIADLFEVGEFHYCDMALREGLIIDQIARRRAYLMARATWPEPRTRSAALLADRCGYNRAHAEQVRRLALSLFDQLAPVHRVDAGYRELLGHACLLHDIGYLIGHRGHHKHSYYLIRNGSLQGFADGEIETIANLARYHRKARPHRAHYSFQHLDKPARRAVCRLIPILRLANALDRTHFSVVKSASCKIRDSEIELSIHSEADNELETWTARRLSPLFEREYGVGLRIVAPFESQGKADHAAGI
jgi:exopolyphosphatase/guanosine-5'-triphosphate,3'-diphosphate pyrophosphatase